MEKSNGKMAKMALEADGNIVGESFIIQPDKNLTGKLGILFGVIEIYNINDAFLDGFLNAVGDLKTEYYLPPLNLERGIEKRFEEAISRANRRIFAAVNQSIEEIDLRNISAAIGLFHDGKVYLSSAGRVKGLFYRRKKNLELLIIDILSGNGESRFRPDPEKIFANILSGELTKRDALLLINEEFLGVFSQKELGAAVLDNPPAEAIKIIDDSLKEKISQKNYYAVIISQPKESEEEASPAKEAETDAIGATVSMKPFRDNAANVRPIGPINNKPAEAIAKIPQKKPMQTQQSIDRLLITQVRTEKYLTPSLLPQWQKALLIILNGIKKASTFSGRKIKVIFLAGAGLIRKLIKAKQPKSINSQDANPKEPEQINREIAVDSFDPPAILMEEINIDQNYAPAGLSNKINFIINNQIEKFLELKKSQRIILIIGLILIFLFSQSVVMIGRANDQPQNSSTANNTIPKQIETLLNNAEAQNIFNDETGALQSLKKSRDLLAQIPDKRFNKALKDGMQSKIDSQARLLQKINSLANPAVIADFSASGTPASLIGLGKSGQAFWTFDNSGKDIDRFDLVSHKITISTTSLPQIMKLAVIDDKNLILMATGKTYYKFDIAKNSSAKIKPSKDYFQLKVPATVSPLIDPPLASSTIAMSISDTYLFFLDGNNGRIIVLDKNGVLKQQYYSLKFNGASAIATSAKDKKLWVFNAGKVYQIDLIF